MTLVPTKTLNLPDSDFSQDRTVVESVQRVLWMSSALCAEGTRIGLQLKRHTTQVEAFTVVFFRSNPGL